MRDVKQMLVLLVVVVGIGLYFVSSDTGQSLLWKLRQRGPPGETNVSWAQTKYIEFDPPRVKPDPKEDVPTPPPTVNQPIDNRDSRLPYLAPIRYTEEEAAQADEFNSKLKSLDPVRFLQWLADTPSMPIPAWRPGRAKPIVCDGKEYYSAYFSIPDENMVPEPLPKTKDWATVIPGRKETYLFKVEADYRKDLENSRFALTRRRYGFATNRNLEILAAGSIPFFCGIHKVPPTGTLQNHPMKFLKQVVYWPNVHVKCDPHKKAAGLPINKDGFNETMYAILNKKVLEYTRQSMLTQHHALYILSSTSLKELPKSVLVLWASHYTIALTGVIHGLRKLGIRVEDVPRRQEVYSGEGCEEAKSKTYAKGWFFFCRANESEGLLRTNIKERIRKKEFDVVIISITDTLTYHMKDPSSEVPHYDDILKSYPRDRIVTMNDADLIKPMQADIAHSMMHKATLYFKRETHGCNEPIW